MKKKFITLWILLVLVLNACAPAATIVAPSATSAPEPTTPPTAAASPTVPPTAAPSTTESAAATPTEHTEHSGTSGGGGGDIYGEGSGGGLELGEYGTQAAPTPAPADPAQEPENGVFFENKQAVMDGLVLNLSDLAAAPSGQTYQGWLLNAGKATSIGIFAPDSSGKVRVEWTSPAGENLFSTASGFQVTLEPGAGSAEPSANVIFSGQFDPARLELAQALFVRNQGEPQTPRNKAYAPAMLDQTRLAFQHIQNAVNAAAIGAETETRVHLEHFINIMEGSRGPRFKDYTGDNLAQNPGDGFGALAYGQALAERSDDPALQQAYTAFEQAAIQVEEQTIALLEATMDKLKQGLPELQTSATALLNGPAANLYRQASYVFFIPLSQAP